MTIKIVCKDCGRDMGTRAVRGVTVTIEVHGCKCESLGFIEGFDDGKHCWQENYGKHGEPVAL